MKLDEFGNIISRISANCAGYRVFASQQPMYGIRQVSIDSTGHRVNLYVFHTLIETRNPKKTSYMR